MARIMKNNNETQQKKTLVLLEIYTYNNLKVNL